jgi:hypothetical protein
MRKNKRARVKARTPEASRPGKVSALNRRGHSGAPRMRRTRNLFQSCEIPDQRAKSAFTRVLDALWRVVRNDVVRRSLSTRHGREKCRRCTVAVIPGRRERGEPGIFFTSARFRISPRYARPVRNDVAGQRMMLGEIVLKFPPSLRGAKQRSNPVRACFALSLDCFAALAMTMERVSRGHSGAPRTRRTRNLFQFCEIPDQRAKSALSGMTCRGETSAAGPPPTW